MRNVFVLFALSLILFSCSGNNLGKMKVFNKTELYYKLGAYLISSEFADGNRKTVQINKEGNTYEFRMVVKKGIDQDQEYKQLGKQMAAEISDEVFDGKQVDVHYCDENMNTLTVMPMSTK
jgi:hypothetical protein